MNRNMIVMLLCPTGQDALLISEALKSENIQSLISPTSEHLLAKKIEEVDVILIAEEALSSEVIE